MPINEEETSYYDLDYSISTVIMLNQLNTYVMKKTLLYSILLLSLSAIKVKGQDLSFDSNTEFPEGFVSNGTTLTTLKTNGAITIFQYGVEAKTDGSNGTILEIASNNNTSSFTGESVQITSSSNIAGIVLNVRSNSNGVTTQPYVTFYDASNVLISCMAVEAGGTGYEQVLYTAPANTRTILIVRTNGIACNGVTAKQQTFRIKNIDVYSQGTPLPNLPLNFLSFTAKPNNQNSFITLNWQTTNEVNTKEFVIERRTESTEFKAIDTKVSNNTSGEHHYTYTDYNALSGKAYYRLKQVDHDAKYQYSDVVVAELKKGPVLSVYPNPAQDVLNVQIGDKSITALQILNTHGQKVLSIHVSEEESSKAINITSLNAGAYILQQVAGTIVKDRYKFIKE